MSQYISVVNSLYTDFLESLPSPVLRAAVLQIQEGDSEVADKGVLPELIRLQFPRVLYHATVLHSTYTRALTFE